ncbi:MAG TPA: hypothetical protein VGN26_02885 [Armatimonadota bacterium]|jgi:hypothetical protein
MLERAVGYVVAHHWGDVASVVGLPLTLGGLALTLLAALRARQAAQVAGIAVAELRSGLAYDDAVEVLSASIAMLEEIRYLNRISVRDAQWLVLERCASMRRKLLTIDTAAGPLTGSHRTTIQNAVTHLRRLEKQLEKSMSQDDAVPDGVKTTQIVSRLLDNIEAVLREVRQGTGA